MSNYAFKFLPKVSEDNNIHLTRYKSFIWSRYFRSLSLNEKIERHHIWPKALGSNIDLL